MPSFDQVAQVLLQRFAARTGQSDRLGLGDPSALAGERDLLDRCWLRDAIERARRQHARLFELRGAVTL